MQSVSENFRIIALGCVLVTLTACSVAQPLADQRDRPPSAISNSLAVLPFNSDSPELAGFAAAVYEEALNQLTEVPDLYIVGGEAILPYLSLNLDAEELATRLGVGHVVGGSGEYFDVSVVGSSSEYSETSKRLSLGVNYLYSHTGQPTVASQGMVFTQELSLSEILSCQSLIASGMVATVKELILSESAIISDEPGSYVRLPESCRS